MGAHLNEWRGDHIKPAHLFLDTRQNEASVQPCGLRGRREDQTLPSKIIVKAGTASAVVVSAVARNVSALGIGTLNRVAP